MRGGLCALLKLKAFRRKKRECPLRDILLCIYDFDDAVISARVTRCMIASIRFFQQCLRCERKALDDGILVNLDHNAAFALKAHLFNIP